MVIGEHAACERPEALVVGSYRNGSGVPIAPMAVLTAKHVVTTRGSVDDAFVLSARRYAVLDVLEHPDARIDLALLRVAGPLPATASPASR